MIGFLRGEVLEVHPSFLLLEVQGVGYNVHTPLSTLSGLHTGEGCAMFIHDHVREDAHDLYGFLSREELVFFQKLIGISGVGPKLALTIMSGGSLEDVRGAIMSGDLARLTSLPGVGKKTAQKIVLELKGQLVEENELGTDDRDVLEALASLGYSTSQAREGLKRVDASIKDVSERVREALKYLGM